MTIGQKIKLAREAKGWSRAELGRQIRYSAAYVGQMESDKHQPSSRVLMALERKLGKLVK